jgi:hypothetical protein
MWPQDAAALVLPHIEGLEPDLIVHHFKKRFMPMVDSWDYVLKEAIELAKIEKAIHL